NVVLENKAFGFIRHEQIKGKLGLYGTDLDGADWAGMARSFGAIGLTATDNASLKAAFEQIHEFRAAGDTRPIVLDAKLPYIDPIDTSFIPLDEQKFGAAASSGFRKLYNLDDEPTLAQLLESQR
ncbi:MAG: thiamine pyrophosphate-dependent enzyme, partial [Bifidobacterium sp.]